MEETTKKIINGYKHIPKDQRKKILLISDDIRSVSGVGCVSKQIIIGTAHYLRWTQISGAQIHNEKGKVINMDKAINEAAGIDDASCTLYPTDGYGNPDMLRQIIQIEKPDAIMLFTDPRFFVWVFQMSHELQQNGLPIIYYNIWDDLGGFCQYNRAFYRSCSMLLGISKQTVNINKTILKNDNYEDWQIKYVPHGINENYYFPISEETNTNAYNELLKKKQQLFKGVEPKFVAMFNSRNIRRKMIPDIIVAFQMFISTLPKEDADKCFLVLHTNPIEEAGTNLYEVIKNLAPDSNVVLHTSKVPEQELNLMYNIADVTVNASSAEGWGLGNTESLMAGTMTITNTIGGLQDQSRFVDDDGKWIDFSEYFPTNSCGRYKTCGEWTLPLFPQLNIVGSVPTPYIYDSRADIKDITQALIDCYNMGREERKRRGMKGREWVMSDESMMSSKWMCKNMITYIDGMFANWKPRKRFEMIDTKIDGKKEKVASGVWNGLKKEWY
jgi:hypothetical protein